MGLKKTPEHDLNKKSGMFLNLGLTISLLLTILAFEWPDRGDQGIINLGSVDDDLEDLLEIPPIKHPPPPPPKVQIPEIIAVPNEKEIEVEFEVELDAEDKEVTRVEDIFSLAAPEEENVDKIFIFVEDQPAFPGGLAAFYKYIGSKIKYPSQAQRMGIEG